MDVRPLPSVPFQGWNDPRREAPFLPHHPSSSATNPALSPVDLFERSADSSSAATEAEEAATGAGKVQIKMHFDLFYELSHKVSARMGTSGGRRFVELAGTVTERFQGRFSLSIDPVGSFLKSTDRSLDISPETTNAFFDAVEGLADLSPEALATFLKASDRFFDDLEKTYGDLGGVFDDLKKQIQDQATAFFQQVASTRASSVSGPDSPPAAEPAPERPTAPDAPLIPLVFGDGRLVKAQDYQEFLTAFLDYARRFREQMMLEFLKAPRPTGGSASIEPPATPKPTGTPLPGAFIPPRGVTSPSQS